MTGGQTLVGFAKRRLLYLWVRLTTSVPVSASFIELDAATALHLGLIIKLTENQAKIAEIMTRPIRSQDLLLVIWFVERGSALLPMLYEKSLLQNDSVFRAYSECTRECHEETGAVGSYLAKQKNSKTDQKTSLIICRSWTPALCVFCETGIIIPRLASTSLNWPILWIAWSWVVVTAIISLSRRATTTCNQSTFGYAIWYIISIFLRLLMRKFDKVNARLSYSPKYCCAVAENAMSP